MEVVLDRERLERKGYDYDEFVVWLDQICLDEGMKRDTANTAALVYGGDDPYADYGNVMVAVSVLEEVPEFLENCKQWLWLQGKHGNDYQEDILSQVLAGR